MEQNQDLDTLSEAIRKRLKADERMTKSSNNKRMTSRIYYEGKVSAFNIVLKLIESIDLDKYEYNPWSN